MVEPRALRSHVNNDDLGTLRFSGNGLAVLLSIRDPSSNGFLGWNATIQPVAESVQDLSP